MVYLYIYHEQVEIITVGDILENKEIQNIIQVTG